MATLLELAKDAFKNHNYILSCEIYERLLRENGRKTTELYFGYGDSLAKCSRIKDALDIYCHICYQLCEIIPVEKLKCLASSIIDFIISKRTNQPPSADECEHVDPLCCPICEDVLKYPVTSLCGHTFCRECCFGRTKCIVCGQKFPVINTTSQNQLEPSHQQPSSSRSSSTGATTSSTGSQVLKNSTITSSNEGASRCVESSGSDMDVYQSVDDAGGRCGGFEQDILVRRLVEKWWSPLLKASELNEEAERYLERNLSDEALKSCNQSLEAGKLHS
jgi:RING-type zinc-finger